MKRLVAALVLSLALPSVALACGDGKCGKDGKAGCPLPATTSGTADALPEGARATLAVTGMKCGACAEKVKGTLSAVAGFKGAVIDPATGKATVSYDAATTSPDKLAAAINADGHFAAKVEG